VTLKVAIVGCGKIADAHVEEIAKMSDLAAVVAVCDRELLMAEQLAMRFGIPRHYDDLDALLEGARPDVVHVTTPPQSHLDLAVRALDAGCHVYVEKPLAPTHADSRRLIEHAHSVERALTVGYTYLFDPPALALRELVAEGVVGEPVHVESALGYDLSGPFGSALLGDASHWVHRLPGGLFQNNIDHVVNKVTEFLDGDSPQVTAQAWTRRPQRFGDARDDMHDELRITLLDGRTSAFGTFSSHVRPAMHSLRVLGTRGTLHADFVSRTVTAEASPSLPSAVGRLLPPFVAAGRFTREGARNLWRFARSDFHFFAGLNRLFRMFYESILEGGPPPIAHRDILRVSWIMDEVFTQIRSSARSR
jgi:predicted dehydrogenase